MTLNTFRNLSIGNDVHFVNHDIPCFIVTNVWTQTQGDELVFYVAIDDGKDKTIINDTEDVMSILETGNDEPAVVLPDTSEFESSPIHYAPV